MSRMKRILQDLYDDQQFCERKVEEQIIGGNRYVFVEFLDRQDQRQWQEERRENEPAA